ncbi:MAG: hypothetical protein WAU07_02195, partial [Microgenomates group bacterium]
AWGGGGTDTSSSDAYQLEGVVGEVGGDRLASSTYQAWPGLLFTQMANVPGTPTVTASGTDYNKLLAIIDTQGNPSDAEYAIAISDDSFTTTEYVQSDNSVGATLGAEDWQTYTDWGAGSGEFIVGLEVDTTYYVKVKARQGAFTESPWSAITTQATDQLTLTFDIDVDAADTETATPYILDFGTLSSSSVTTTTEKVWVDISSNASGGGVIYVYSTNGGLYSDSTAHTISAVSGNLSSATEGFGLQSSTVDEASGGPLAAMAPYDGTSEVVGTVGSTPAEMYTTSSSPIVDGRGSFVAKAKVSGITPAAGDYADTLTVIAAGIF